MNAEMIRQLIVDGLPGAEVQVNGDDGVHFEAIVISDVFAGKTMLVQHRMIYDILGTRMQDGEIHALALRTYSRQQWDER